MRTWIRDPLAILAPNAPRGLVVEDDRIVELVETAGPKIFYDGTFDASHYVIIPGLINTHHHFFQTLTRAHPAAINKPLFPWLQALYPIWGAKLDRDNFRLGVRLALTELLMSGCTTASDHLYAFTHDMADAVDIEVQEAGSRSHAALSTCAPAGTCSLTNGSCRITTFLRTSVAPWVSYHPEERLQGAIS
jgi:8-oxoguanine deaminase